jgi:hypothetical protein
MESCACIYDPSNTLIASCFSGDHNAVGHTACWTKLPEAPGSSACHIEATIHSTTTSDF